MLFCGNAIYRDDGICSSAEELPSKSSLNAGDELRLDSVADDVENNNDINTNNNNSQCIAV